MTCQELDLIAVICYIAPSETPPLWVLELVVNGNQTKKEALSSRLPGVIRTCSAGGDSPDLATFIAERKTNGSISEALNTALDHV